MTKREQIVLRIPIQLNKSLIEEAKNKGISRNALVIQKLWELNKPK